MSPLPVAFCSHRIKSAVTLFAQFDLNFDLRYHPDLDISSIENEQLPATLPFKLRGTRLLMPQVISYEIVSAMLAEVFGRDRAIAVVAQQGY